MRHVLSFFVALLLFASATSDLHADVITFQQNQDNGTGEYEWEANNWYVLSVPEYRAPNSADTGRIMSNRSCLIDGQSGELETLTMGYDGSGTGTLTIDSGSLRIYGTGMVALTLGKNSGATLNINGGTMTVDSTYVHGGIRVGQTYDGTLNLSGGTLIVDNASFGYDADATVTISGGEFNAAGRVMITHQGTKVTDSSITISGDADVNLTGTGYNDGLNVYEGGTLRIVGSNATIDIAYNLWMGGWTDTDPNATLSFQSDAGGVSTINCRDLTVAAGSILDLSSDGGTSTGTYTLVSSTNSVTQGDLNNFTFSPTTDPNEWSNLTVTGAGPYLVQVDHTGRDPNAPPTYTLTVNSGTGDGDYEENTVVNIVANTPPSGQIFDVWTDDTANVDNVNAADTNITMPATAAEVTATYADDPTTFQLIVDLGDGDGFYDPNTVVQIVANNPPTGEIFDRWTGDTSTVANVLDPNTTLTMPIADTEVTATYESDPNYVFAGRGYFARACGFDMDRNGIIGEPGDDDNVGDGVTTDPDGDGIDEDIIYVDANDGDDTTGDGSAGNPYKTIQKALDMCDGPGDGAEDIVAIAGTFQEELTLTQSGVAGYYVRDSFQFPDNPTMLIGWDKDNDGEYPPYDTDDIAVLDGNVVGNLLPLAISNFDNRNSYIELAHLTVQNYGYRGAGDHGAIRFCGNSGTISHFYVHDVEFRAINKGIDYSGYVVVWSFWSGGTNFTYMGMINVLLDEFASFAVRGAPVGNSGHYRWQNLTMNFSVADNETATAWKLWGEHSDVEILDSIINGSPNDWTYGLTGTGPNGIAVCQCSQGWVIRNNEFHDLSLSVTMQGDAGPLACQSRPVDDIVIDRNIFRNTVDWQYRPRAIYIRGGALTTATTATVTITNNFMSATNGWDSGIRCQAGNNEGTQPGSVTIVGNTIYGPFVTGWEGQGIAIEPSYTYKQQNFVIKNNIIANVGGGDNIGVTYAPSNFVANGNLYDDSGDYVWDGNDLATLAAWQTATGEDANSSEGDPNFIDDANGDFHLDPSDTIATGAGVDISSIVDHDIDGDTRDASTKTAGADVDMAPSDTEPPTVLTWKSAASHGRGVGEALLTIADDGTFCEPRSAGIAKLIVEFSEAVAPLSFTTGSVDIAGLDANGTAVTLGGISIGVFLQSGDTEGVITFTPSLPDYARYIVRLSDVTDVAGNSLSGDVDRILTALVGDVSGDRQVNTADLSLSRGARTKLIDGSDAGQVRADVSGDGRVNVADLSYISGRRGNDARGIVDPVIP